MDHNDNIWFTPKGGELLKFNIQSKQFTIYDSTNTNIGKVLIQQLIIDAKIMFGGEQLILFLNLMGRVLHFLIKRIRLN